MRTFGLILFAMASFAFAALAQPSKSPTFAPPSVQSLEGTWRVSRLISPSTPAEVDSTAALGKTITVSGGRLRGEPSCRWDEMNVSDNDLAADTATRARLAGQKIVSQGRGIYEFTWMCGNAMGVTFIVVPGPTSTTYLRDMRGVYELSAASPGPTPPATNTRSDGATSEAELRKLADRGDVLAAEKLADLSHQRGRADDEQRYRNMAESGRFAQFATALPGGRPSGRTASAAEPSFEDLRAAIRDMEACRLLHVRGDRFKLPWDRSHGTSRYDFNSAVTALKGHGEFRPDFSSDQRQALRGVWWLLTERVEAEFPSLAGMPEAAEKCKTRFNELKPMFKSYRTDPALLEECIKAYAEREFPIMIRTYAADKFELFAVFPRGISSNIVVSRPDRVAVRFAFLKLRASQDGPPVTPYFEYSDLTGGCPTKR